MKFSRPSRVPGRITVQSTNNNTILTLTDHNGKTLAWTSAGVLGFKNSRKSTTYGAQAAAEHIAMTAQRLGITRIHLSLKGLGFGKESSVRALAQSGIEILSIMDNTPIAHNGCRQPRVRRT